MSVHDRLDLERWIRAFPLSRLRAEARSFVRQREQEHPSQYLDSQAVENHIQLMSPKWEIVVGPPTVAVNEQLRTEAVAGRSHLGKRLPTDVAVWARGEPRNRAITKVGGLPYRPSDAPWPSDGRGEPMRFIVQICFADSRDLVPPLPGDILLVFGDDDALVAEPERLVFEWWPLACESLVSEAPAVEEPL